MKTLTIIWSIFALVYLSLAVFHFISSTHKIEGFKPHERPAKDYVKVDIAGSDIDQPIMEFTDDFNEHISRINKSNRRNNIVSGVGYVLAFITALISIYITEFH